MPRSIEAIRRPTSAAPQLAQVKLISLCRVGETAIVIIGLPTL
ncbi:hypothetical protein RHOER0001_6572 [Rhodococcus erythropolis SK121]|nr:hypothetical protein RHOER0001_6572 [Rhodococcus erythropolis SK121]